MPQHEQTRLGGWLVLAVLATAFAISALVVATWRAFHSDFTDLLFLPLNLALYAWIASGALRRHRGAPTSAS